LFNTENEIRKSEEDAIQVVWNRRSLGGVKNGRNTSSGTWRGRREKRPRCLKSLPVPEGKKRKRTKSGSPAGDFAFLPDHGIPKKERKGGGGGTSST